jgi:glucose-1-phosphate adenylyltransferase
MEMLEPQIRNMLFFKSGLVYTRVKDEVPAKYSENANVENCIVADGCILDGEVTNSVLFRGVKIYGGAKVKNSIIMQDSEVHDDAIVENAILDKEVIIRKGKRLTGQENYPLVIGKGAVI